MLRRFEQWFCGDWRQDGMLGCGERRKNVDLKGRWFGSGLSGVPGLSGIQAQSSAFSLLLISRLCVQSSEMRLTAVLFCPVRQKAKKEFESLIFVTFHARVQGGGSSGLAF